MDTLPKSLQPKSMPGGTYDTLWCMFKHGPTQDGNVPSKCGRDELVADGFAERFDGWNWLTYEGVTLALDQGMGRKKDSCR